MKIELSAWAVGEVAGELLAPGSPAIVMGVTSRGVFLRLGQGVVFLSTEPYRGPLTVNLVGGLPAGLEVGVELAIDLVPSNGGVIPSDRAVILSDGSVILSDRAVILSENDVILSENDVILSDSEGSPLPVHSAYPVLPSEIAWNATAVSERLSQMIDLVLVARPEGDASRLLRELLSLSLELAPKAEDHPRMPHETSNDSPPEPYSCIRGHILGRDASDSTSNSNFSDLLPLLGRGEGLTPWGDDLIIGLLLAGHTIRPDGNYAALAEQLTAAAFGKTSLLSANLIACAARGLADERLLLALSALLAGEPSIAAGADGLLGWGRTSGVAALAGMACEILRCAQDDL